MNKMDNQSVHPELVEGCRFQPVSNPHALTNPDEVLANLPTCCLEWFYKCDRIYRMFTSAFFLII
jgi:hypothetical protein